MLKSGETCIFYSNVMENYMENLKPTVMARGLVSVFWVALVFILKCFLFGFTFLTVQWALGCSHTELASGSWPNGNQ